MEGAGKSNDISLDIILRGLNQSVVSDGIAILWSLPTLARNASAFGQFGVQTEGMK